MPEHIILKSSSEINASADDIKFEINMKDLSAGEHTVKISANLPDGLSFEKEYTAKISVKNN